MLGHADGSTSDDSTPDGSTISICTTAPADDATPGSHTNVANGRAATATGILAANAFNAARDGHADRTSHGCRAASDGAISNAFLNQWDWHLPQRLLHAAGPVAANAELWRLRCIPPRSNDTTESDRGDGAADALDAGPISTDGELW